MAVAPKKTYSKRDNGLHDIIERKENVDPFDVLLASPLKQDVQFQPLCFWDKSDKKVSDLESKKKGEVKCRLYQGSDSYLHNSSSKKSKSRTVQPKSKLNGGRKNHFTTYSFNKSDKHTALSNESITLKSAKEILRHKGFTPKNMNEILNLSSKSCDEHLNSYSSIGSFKKFNKEVNKTFYPVNIRNSEEINNKNVDLKACKYTSSAEWMKDTKEYKVNKCNKDSINKTTDCSKIMEETVVLPSEGCDIFKFVTIKRHFSFPKCFSYNLSLDGSSSPVQSRNSEGEIVSQFSLDLNMDDTTDAEFSTNICDTVNDTTDAEFSTIISDTVNDTTDAEFSTIISDTVNDTADAEFSTNIHDTVNDTTEAEFSTNISDTVNDSLLYNASVNEILFPEDVVGQKNIEESFTILESLGVTLSSDSDLKYISNSDLEDVTEELLEQESVDLLAETSSASDDTFSEEKTVIKISQEPQTGNSVPQVENDASNHSALSTNAISLLTTGISDLSITKATGNELINTETEKLENCQRSAFEDTDGSSFSVELRNIMTKRGGFVNYKNGKKVPHNTDVRSRANPTLAQEDVEFDQTLELSCITGRMSLDWNKTMPFGNPVFESTRVFDTGSADGEVPQKQFKRLEKINHTLEETHSGLDHTYVLKPGKQWVRCISVLKQIQKGGVFESTRITGRKFESFVQDLLKMQNEKSNFFTTLTDVTVSGCKPGAKGNVENDFFDRLSGTVLQYGSQGEKESEFGDSSFERTIGDKTVLGKSLFNHTVKVVQPEDCSSAFRSALGLDTNRSLIQGSMSSAHSIRQERSEISARDFILIQCGQEDVLPFEEYFNEKTLPNCKKIGEGVYGEVFLCSDTVIKIIPIEGSEPVNGAPQKTFEEIISEVVIANKLSNLREGERNRTDGFSEMKRCWCVRGKYPEYLLKLWKIYDQSGSGSENDSPVMFKDDQLYIILELGNGGKDLESFVFSSSLQALSVFIQTAFSLAAAEKAFEFEHRDLHWGNVLISKTNDKVTTVAVDGTEYRIPTKGVKVCIIDFTLSRINHEGCCIYNDLASDPELFTAHGDYQFEIYRMMQTEVKNEWSTFSPKTNLFWLHYTLDKMIKMVRYQIHNSKVHSKHMKNLKTLESVVLEHKNSTSFVLSKSLNDIMKKL